MEKISARIARSLVTVLLLTFVQVIAAPILTPQISSPIAQAATFDSTNQIVQMDVNLANTFTFSSTRIWDQLRSSDAIESTQLTYTSTGGGYVTFDNSVSSGKHASFSSSLTPYLDATSATTKKNLSVFMWVYPTGDGVILDEIGNDNTVANPVWHDSQIEMVSGTMKFRVWNITAVTSSIATPLNNWYYVGYTYDAVNQVFKAYVNGQLAGTTSSAVRSVPWEDPGAYGSFFSIGRADTTHMGSGAGGNFRFGSLHIFKSPLTQSTIQNNFEAQQSRFAPVVSTPASQTTYTNRMATFSATACTGITSGSTSCNYQWQQSTDSGTTFSDISGATNLTYKTPVLTSASNGYMYRLKVIDPGTGTSTAPDLYSFTSAATLTLTTPPGGETDTAMNFNGVNQYAEIGDTAGSPFDLTGTLTIEAWVYFTTDCSSDQAIFAKVNSYMLYCGGGFIKYVFDADGAAWGGTVSVIKIQKDEWHHLALSKSSASTTAYLYVDGQLAATLLSVGASTMTPNDGAINIGRYGAGTYFQGAMDEVRLYNSQRTQSQIASDMNNYGPISDSDLVAYYDFNEGTGSTLYNRSNNAISGSDLTIYGAPTWSDVKSVDKNTISAYTITTFPRSYLTANGGWKVPTGVADVSALIVAGGGGGGWNSGGGGGGGGLLYIPKTTVSGSVAIKVGAGGIGSFSTDNGSTPTIAPGTGQSSTLGSTTVAGGNPGLVFAGSVTAGGAAITTASGSSGAGGAGSGTSGVAASSGATGLSSSLSGSLTIYSSGGGGGGWSSAGGAAGAGAGAGGGSTTQNTGSNALKNRGGGGGASAAHVFSGSGGSGVIIIRWITAAKPSFTKPTTAYLNAGMTETFTTNIAQDSETAHLTRTFRWESSTTGSNGTFSVIKQGTGAANAFFAWTPQDTATSGANFVYRVVVTDSDTAGLFIVDTSTPVFAIINKALTVSGNSIIGKAINVSKNETFTVSFGTPTYRPVLSPVILGITLDTSTAGSPVIRIGETVTVGTYYETLTVYDSVSAAIITPLTIIVSPPPTFTATSEQVDSSTVLYLDAGNSASLTPSSPTTWRDISGRGLRVNFPPTSYPVGTTSCAAPGYSNDYMGILNFATDTCGYIPNVSAGNLTYPYTYQAWIKRNGSMGTASIDGDYTSIVATPWETGRQIGLTLHWRHALNSADYYLEAGVWGNPTWYSAKWATPIPAQTWVYVTVTFTGSAISISINNQTPVTASVGTTISSASIDSGLIFGKRFDQGAGYYFNGSIASFRLYNRVLANDEITQNFNATKSRFESANQNQLTPSQKYGQSQIDTYTATSGYGNKAFTFVTGDRTGVDWDTATANTVKLSIQDSLTVGTYFDTITVTDSLSQSTYLPIKMSISKADTITVTLRNPKTLVYTGLPAAQLPDINITGLVSSDTGTATRLYSAPASLPGATDTYTALTRSSSVPIDVETYTVTVDTLTSLTRGSLSNYEGVIYETSTLTITKANQPSLMVNYFGAIAGSSYTLKPYGGAGTGAFTETTTSGSSALNCSISGHVLTNASPSTETKTCVIIVTRAASRNYKAESMTATIYFFAFTFNSQPQSGTGPGIGLTGINTVTLDSGTAPNISGLSTTSLSLSSGGNFTITGGGFGTSQITVKFWRNKIIYATSTNGTTLVIPVSAINAVSPTTGKVMVITPNGIAVSTDTLTITP